MSFIKRHPKFTLIAFNMVVILGLVFLAEQYFRVTKDAPEVVYENHGEFRAVNLREGRPFCDAWVTPGDYWFHITDNIVKKPYHLKFDENGFLTPSKIYDNPDKEIFFLGGSTTFCEHVDEKYRFPVLVGEIMSKESGLKINTYNGGLYKNNTLHSINALINKVVPHSPDMAVLMHVINDVSALATYGTYWDLNSHDIAPILPVPQELQPIKSFFKSLKDMMVPNLYEAILRAKSSGGSGSPENYGKGETTKRTAEDIIKYNALFKKNLQLFISTCRNYDIEPVLMTQAHRMLEQPDTAVFNYVEFLCGRGSLANPGNAGQYVPLTYPQMQQMQVLFNETIRQTAAEAGIRMVDLDKNIPKTKEYMYDAVHLTEKGSKKAAALIAAELAANKSKADTTANHLSFQ